MPDSRCSTDTTGANGVTSTLLAVLNEALRSDRADRAHAASTMAGYRPCNRHGVEGNSTLLAEAKRVPKAIDDRSV